MKNKKIKTLKELKKVIEKLKKQKKKIVFANGCFDIIHAGHIELFRKAKSFGDVLVVAVNSDSSIRRLKGPTRPVVPEEYRMEVLSAIEYIDYIVKYNEDTPWETITAIYPNVVVKGGDWTVGTVVGRQVAKVKLVKLVSGISTTKIIEKIKKMK